MNTVRIDEIEVVDFRGFPADVVPAIKLSGKNLLLYGENGSGKSTLFQALFQMLDVGERQQFDANLADTHCLKNRFTDVSLTIGRVVLTFTSAADIAIAPMNWNIGGKRPTSHPFFAAMSRTRGFLDYRALLQTHFVHREKDGVNLFSLLVENLLRDVEFPTRALTFGEEWEAIVKAGRDWITLAGRDPSKMDDTEKILYELQPSELEDGEGIENFDEKAAFERHVMGQREAIRKRVKGFNDALWQRILETQAVANRFIASFDLWLEIDFSYPNHVKEPDLAADLPWPGNPQLLLRAKFHGQMLEHPATFLNEARLTAIALALYLAALKVEIPVSAGLGSEVPRLLVLDDVLIGLDLANRLPVLRIIEEQFASFQVLLFTFDRAWYEVAKQKLPSGAWCHYELFAIRVGDHEQPLLLPDEDHLYRALAFLDKGQTKASSVHVRTAFESLLKRACEQLRLSVKFNPDPRKVPASDLWAALRSAELKFKPARECAFDKDGKVHWWQPKTREKKVVSPSLQERIEHAVSWILNPLNHSQDVERYRVEIEDAIYAIDDLERTVRQAIAAPTVRQTVALEELVSLLRAYIEKMQSAKTATTAGGSHIDL